jgi:hypothetical protein
MTFSHVVKLIAPLKTPCISYDIFKTHKNY